MAVLACSNTEAVPTPNIDAAVEATVAVRLRETPEPVLTPRPTYTPVSVVTPMPAPTKFVLTEEVQEQANRNRRATTTAIAESWTPTPGPEVTPTQIPTQAPESAVKATATPTPRSLPTPKPTPTPPPTAALHSPVIHDKPVVPPHLVLHTEDVIYPISRTILDNCPDESQDVIFCISYATRFSRTVCEEQLILAIREQGQEATGKSMTYAGREAEYMLDSNQVLYGRHFRTEFYAENSQGAESLWAVTCSFNFVTWSVENYSLKLIG